MRRDDLRYNRKTKAAAVACFASCLIRPVKGFEYVGGLFLRNSGAVILIREFCIFSLAVNLDQDF